MDWDLKKVANILNLLQVYPDVAWLQECLVQKLVRFADNLIDQVLFQVQNWIRHCPARFDFFCLIKGFFHLREGYRWHL
jgi:hypothetical protein